MTAIISLIAVAVLSLSAGFFVLSTGRRKPESGKPADHKLNIRKAPNLAVQEVNDDPPEGLSDLECAALLLEERERLVGEVLDVMKTLAKDGMTMLVVTHEMAFARDVSSHVVYMHGGVIHEQGAPAEIFGNPQKQETKDFLSRFLGTTV